MSICLSTVVFAGNIDLDKACLSCHQKQKIPSDLIYRRYLMMYSTDKAIATAMQLYLGNPKINNSIMPRQFFFKFSMKDRLEMDSLSLYIEAYIKKFDIKKKLYLGS